MSNKIVYGISNVWYAVLKQDYYRGVEYAKPVPLQGAVLLSLKPESTIISLKSESSEVGKLEDNLGYTGELELLKIPDQFRVDVLGEKISGEGIAYEDKTSKSNYFALLFEFSGNIYPRRYSLLKCRCERLSMGVQTMANKINNVNDVLLLTVIPRVSDGKIKAVVDEANNKDIYDNWFNEVNI